MRLFNKAAHVLIGIGLGYLSTRNATFALMGTGAFLGYQAIEESSKGDLGYPEVREFGVGLAVGLAIDWLFRRR